MPQRTPRITRLIERAAKQARKETSDEPEPDMIRPIHWPIDCTVGPGLEGAIACETKVGYVNGAKGWLIYGGYNIFDLCARCTFEEVSYLLLHGHLPDKRQLERYERKLKDYRRLSLTLRQLQSFSVEELNTMAALRLGTLFMRQKQTYRDRPEARPLPDTAIGTDEDSIPMETKPTGEPHAIYEFKHSQYRWRRPRQAQPGTRGSEGLESCYHLISGVAVITAAIARTREGKLPMEPRDDLGHAANFLYMMTGEEPTAQEARVMDVAMILHADHGMNASTFAAMVVASTLSDIYFAVGAGIAALNGPLHGGANEQVIHTLREIGDVKNVKKWYKRARERKMKVPGFGHRVYKAYDPRARVLGPLARMLAKNAPEIGPLLEIADALEQEVVKDLGKKKKVFPNVDFYSGLTYGALGIEAEMFGPIFAVARVAGWSARVLEYLRNNRIFRPRAMYVGGFHDSLPSMRARGRARKRDGSGSKDD